MFCCSQVIRLYSFFKRIVKMIYRIIFFICLQAFCQNVNSQAITPPAETTEVTITETIIEKPGNQPEETAKPAFGPCGRPIHLCDCARRAELAITEGYSNVVATVANQPDPQICPKCGLAAELCQCGSEVAVTETGNQESNQTVCPKCGRLVELCICSAEVASGEQENSPKLCPHCGHPIELCICNQAAVATSSVVDSTSPAVCAQCGHPVELCKCSEVKTVLVD